MLYFPQLDSLAMAQYPVGRKQVFRTVVSQTEDGRIARYADTGATHTEWRLELSSLTDLERQRLDSLFVSTRGSLRTFTFLDPLDNLLFNSEDLTAASWSKQGGVQIDPGVADHLGTLRATAISNPGLLPGRLFQVLPTPPNFQYCLSVYVRASPAGVCSLLIGRPDTPSKRSFSVDEAWARCIHRARDQQPGDELIVGIEIASGATVELFGFQLEAQIAPSAYRRTLGKSGIRTNARFLSDTLSWKTDGPSIHNTIIQIESY